MKHSEALLGTSKGAKYIRQLCLHWSHHFPVDYNEIAGRIELPQTVCKFVATSSSLLLQLDLQADADQESIEGVVEEHLRRFAVGEEINLTWRRR